MEDKSWKILGIVLLILFVSENLLIGFLVIEVYRQEGLEKDCLYNFCEEYPYAEYDGGVCACYESDMFGEYIIAKTQYG